MFSPAVRTAALSAILFAVSLPLAAQTLAFPGALGFGQYATGGRSGSVYHVTTLADSGTGSFRTAVSSGNRIIVFDVGGYINLQTAVTCSSGLTIAGETAPGGGIGIMGAEVSFTDRNNIICRHVRFRQGDIHNASNSSNAGESAINLGGSSSTAPATNMIFDHISVAFGSWDSVDAVNTTTFTVQNSIIADPINQQFGAHHEGDSASWIRNLWVNAHNRQPLAKANTIYINNVCYNYQAGYTCGDTGGFFSHDIINNYFITGPSTTSAGNDFYQIDANQSTYAYGNLRDSDNNGALGGSGTDPNEGGPVLTAPWSPVTTNIPTYSTVAAYRIDVSMSGAFPHDQVDAQVIGNVTSLGTAGRQFNGEDDTGLGNSGYGIINSGIAAIDTDGDGMPDYWEKAAGLNPNVNDAMTIASDGYANIEHYLNWLADPHALTTTNAPVDVDLWQYTGGFTNAGPVYVLSGGSNGVAVLNGGHIAHFTPALNFSGLGGFQFTVTANDGSSYTNVVNVLMTPIAPPQNLVWQGDGTANVWTNGGPANWLNGSNLVAFASGDNVTFDDTGTNTPAINLSGAISAGIVYVLADNQDYTFGGNGYLSGGTALFKTGAGRLNLDTTNTATGSVTINEGVVQIGDGVSFNGGLAGNVTNNDTLIYATPGTLTSAVNISGAGTVTETGPGSLTISGTQTYTGPTTVNAGSLTFSGSVPPSDITNGGVLKFSASSPQVYTNTISGPGTVAMIGGTLTLGSSNSYAGNTTNQAGTLYIANNNALGSGIMVYTNGNVWLTGGVTVTNDYSISGASAIDLCMAATNGTCTWAGNVINLQSSAQWRPGADGGTLVFLGNALIGGRNFIVPRGTVQFASNAVVAATGGATAFGRDTTGGNRSASVTIKDNAVVTLGVCNLGGGQAGGNSTLTIQNSAVLSCGANNFDVQNVNRATATTFIRLNGGTFTVGGFTKTKTGQTNSIAFNGGVLKAGANNSAFLPQFNFTTNVVQSGGAIVDDGGFAIAINGPLIHDPGLGAAPDGGLTKLGAGTLTLGSFVAGVQQTYTGPTIISAGTLVLVSSIANSAGIYVGSGALLDIPVGSFTVASGRTLWGNGLVMGNFTAIANGATLAPGSNSIGTLTFSNSLTLAAGSTNLFEITRSPLTNDSAVVFGALTNGGTLIVTNLGGPQLAAGDTFKLFNAASYAGTFSSVKLPPLPFGLAWNTNSLNTAGTISVALATAPAIGSISISPGGLGFSGTGGVGGANFILLGTTNLGGPWTPLFTNQFDIGGNFNFTNAFGAGPQTFYRLQLQ